MEICIYIYSPTDGGRCTDVFEVGGCALQKNTMSEYSVKVSHDGTFIEVQIPAKGPENTEFPSVFGFLTM